MVYFLPQIQAQLSDSNVISNIDFVDDISGVSLSFHLSFPHHGLERQEDCRSENTLVIVLGVPYVWAVCGSYEMSGFDDIDYLLL